jgi:hypothetical protein
MKELDAMISLKARVPTANARRYLTQLCKHFAHKIPVEYDDDRGRADFPWGICHLEAEEGLLVLRCEGGDNAALDQVIAVVDDHLRRFGWRETLTLDWQPD